MSNLPPIHSRNKKAPRETMGRIATLFLAKSVALSGSRRFPDFRPSGHFAANLAALYPKHVWRCSALFEAALPGPMRL
jgi:hypothetical protein